MQGSIEEIEVSDDHLLLQEIIEEHGITVKRLALETGRGGSTMYKYCSGEATIPSIVWRKLYEMTQDVRILKLFTGAVTVAVVPVVKSELKLDKITCKRLLSERTKQNICERRVLNILADGRIDARDRREIEKYRREFPEMIQMQYQTFEAVNRQCQEALKKERTSA